MVAIVTISLGATRLHCEYCVNMDGQSGPLGSIPEPPYHDQCGCRRSFRIDDTPTPPPPPEYERKYRIDLEDKPGKGGGGGSSGFGGDEDKPIPPPEPEYERKKYRIDFEDDSGGGGDGWSDDKPSSGFGPDTGGGGGSSGFGSDAWFHDGGWDRKQDYNDWRKENSVDPFTQELNRQFRIFFDDQRDLVTRFLDHANSIDWSTQPQEPAAWTPTEEQGETSAQKHAREIREEQERQRAESQERTYRIDVEQAQESGGGGGGSSGFGGDEGNSNNNWGWDDQYPTEW